MKKEFVDYTEALVLKELGFDEPCFGFYYLYKDENYQEGKFDYRGELNIEYSIYKENTYYILAPTFSQAFRWFREKYKLDGIAFWNYTGYMWNIIDIEKSNKITNITIQDDDMEEYVTKEKSELGCLKKLIEIVKEK